MTLRELALELRHAWLSHVIPTHGPATIYLGSGATFRVLGKGGFGCFETIATHQNAYTTYQYICWAYPKRLR